MPGIDQIFRRLWPSSSLGLSVQVCEHGLRPGGSSAEHSARLVEALGDQQIEGR
ncbi:MAG: hypothetical protein HN377_02305, partial [Alphaproteobacteria bacterium]|nr:hypothetical protein [Alphaproteobacteria bacterium]